MDNNTENHSTDTVSAPQPFNTEHIVGAEQTNIPQSTVEKQYTMRVPQQNTQPVQYGVPNQGYSPSYAVPQHSAEYSRSGQTMPQYPVYQAPVQNNAPYQMPYRAPAQMPMGYNRYPQPAYAGASLPAQYPYNYGMYNYTPSPQEAEKAKLKKTFSFTGKTTLILLGGIYLAAILIEVFAVVCGVSQRIPDMKTDPYMGFTPMGFYLYEGLASLLGIFIPALLLIKSSKMSFNEVLPFNKIEKKFGAALVFGGLAVCMIAQIAASILITNVSLFGIDIQSALETATAASPFDIFMSSICTALIPALVEEFAYRGLVLSVLKKHDEAFAIFASAFLFGLLHGNFVQIPFAFIVGLVLAFVRVKSDSMLPGIIIHFCNNFFAVIVTAAGEALPENISTIIQTVFMLLFIIAGFIAISYLVKNHKEIFEPKKSETSFRFGELTRMFLSTGTVIACMVILVIMSLVLVASV